MTSETEGRNGTDNYLSETSQSSSSSSSSACELKNDKFREYSTIAQQNMQMNKILELDTDNCIDSFKGEALLIDDSIVAAKVASKVLEKLRFKTTICASAQDGFDVLKENSKRFAFVMLDIVMPNVDGVECLSWIKDDPQISHIPVYMLSGLEDQTLTDVCLERGADGMLLKPLITEVVKKLLHPSSKGESPMMATSGNLNFEKDDSIANRRGQVRSNPSKSHKILQIGRQALAFRLHDSNYQEFNYPSDTDKFRVVMGFAPTIFLPDIHVSNGLMDLLKSYYKTVGSKKALVFLVTSDLHYSLAEAKILYQVPFTLLSDSCHRVSEKFVGTFDLGEKLTVGKNIPYDSTVHKNASPLIGITFLDKKRNLLNSWTTSTAHGRNVDITMLPPSMMDWIKIHEKQNSLISSGSYHENGMIYDSGNHYSKSNSGCEKREMLDGSIEMDVLTDLVEKDVQYSVPRIGKHDTCDRVPNMKVVLIVDDSSISSRVAVKKIESLGYNTEATYNGQLAYDLLCVNPEKYALVMCDICMPVCDGVGLLKMIKSEPKLSHLPVLILSSLDSREIDEDLMKMGALEIMKKPFENSKFLSAMEKTCTVNL